MTDLGSTFIIKLLDGAQYEYQAMFYHYKLKGSWVTVIDKSTDDAVVTWPSQVVADIWRVEKSAKY